VQIQTAIPALTLPQPFPAQHPMNTLTRLPSNPFVACSVGEGRGPTSGPHPSPALPSPNEHAHKAAFKSIRRLFCGRGKGARGTLSTTDSPSPPALSPARGRGGFDLQIPLCYRLPSFSPARGGKRGDGGNKEGATPLPTTAPQTPPAKWTAAIAPPAPVPPRRPAPWP